MVSEYLHFPGQKVSSSTVLWTAPGGRRRLHPVTHSVWFPATKVKAQGASLDCKENAHCLYTVGLVLMP